MKDLKDYVEMLQTVDTSALDRFIGEVQDRLERDTSELAMFRQTH